MSTKAQKAVADKSAAPIQLEWPRADPAALAKFDPSTKTCTMNCGPHARDPRSRTERFFLCDDCQLEEPQQNPG